MANEASVRNRVEKGHGIAADKPPRGTPYPGLFPIKCNSFTSLAYKALRISTLAWTSNA
jgi:hypothetical protein